MTQQSSGVLFLVATPIGNLKDITLRALETLQSVDLIICEDTRHTGSLLKHFEIKKPLQSFHDHSSAAKTENLIEEINNGKRVAYVTDAGTPLISDPGFPLVREAIRRGIRIESLPGATAFVQALILSGLPCDSFTFFGFLPMKQKKRRDLLHSLRDNQHTLVFYESPYRLVESLKDIADIIGSRRISVSRELTKLHEEVFRSDAQDAVNYFQTKKVLGELVIVIDRAPAQ